MGTDEGGKTSFRARLDPLGPVDCGTQAAPAAGSERCRDCGRKHGTIVRCLPDGRWFDADELTWRDRRGRSAKWPNVVEYAEVRDLPVSIRPVRLSAKPGAKPRSLCQRCQMVLEAAHNGVRRRLRALSRRALGEIYSWELTISRMRSSASPHLLVAEPGIWASRDGGRQPQ